MCNACVLSHFSHVQLFATLGGSPPVSSVLGILQARTLECVASSGSPDPDIEPASLMSPALAGRLLTTSATWEAQAEATDGAEIRNFNSAQLLTTQTKKNEDIDFNNAVNSIDLMTTFRMINRGHSS